MAAISLIACGSSEAPRPTQTAPATDGAGRAPAPTEARPSPTPTPTGAVRYVAIGASDAVGVGAVDPRTGSWPARVASRLPEGSTFTNAGVSGSLAAQAAREQLPQALAARPNLVTVWLAVNDIIGRVAPDQYARDLSSVVDPLISATEARVFIGTVPDLRAVPAFADVDKAALAQLVSAYNVAIAGLAARYGDRVVAVDLFSGSAELVSSATVTPDGLHPTDRGYQLVADRFVEALRAAGYRLR